MKVKKVVVGIVGCVIVGVTLSFALPSGGRTNTMVIHKAPDLTPLGAPRPRRILGTGWDTLARVATGTAKHDLAGAYRLMALPKELAVFADSREQLFVFPTQGQGGWETPPGAIGFGRDLKVDARGNLLIVDQRKRVLWRYAQSGPRPDTEATAAMGEVDQIAPLTDGRIVALAPFLQHPLFVIGQTGDRPWIPVPGSGFIALHPMQRQGLLASDPTTSHWVYALELADGWFAYDGAQSRGFVGQYVEHTATPIIVTDSQEGAQASHLGRAVVSALSVTMRGSIVSILFAGSTPLRNHVIDTYLWDTGEYLGSYVLPVDATAIAAAGRRTYAVLITDPEPTLLLLRAR